MPSVNHLILLFFQDVAILTNDVERCVQYQNTSQNVQSRFYCSLPQGYIVENMNPPRNRRQPIPIDKETCEVREGVYIEG